MSQERSYSVFESYLKIIFVVGGIVVASFFFFSYILNNPLRSKAAVGPNGVNITLADIATGSTETVKKVGVTIQPVTATNKITAFDLRINVTGAKIASIVKPAGFSDELFNKPADTPARFAYTVGSTGEAQNLIYMELMIEKTTAETATVSVATGASEVVGTLSQIAFDLDTAPVTHTVTFGPVIEQTPYPTPLVTGGPTIGPTGGVVPTVPPGGGGLSAMKLQLAVRLQGILSKPVTSGGEVFVLRLRGPTDLDTKITLTPDDQGVYRGSVDIQAKPGNTYRMYIKGPRHLQKKLCVNAPTESAIGSYRCGQAAVALVAGGNDFDLTRIVQLVGDLPSQDGVVDSYDTSYIRQSIGSRDPVKLQVGDLNRDGIIDTQDMSLVIQSLNIKYDEE